MTDTAKTRKPGKNAFMFVVVAVALNMLCFGIVMPIMPALLAELTDQPIEIAIKSNGWLAVVYAVANFLAMPLLGGLSDQYGRRPVLLISMAMLAVDLLIMGLAPTLGILFLGRALAGFFSATVSVANAYVADVTAPEDRGRAFGMLGASFGFGFILGPVFGGLLGEIDTHLPFFVAAGFAALNFLFGYFVLPESLSPENRRPFSLARANPFGAVKHFAKLPRVAWFIITIGVFQIAHSVYPTTWNYHGASRYGWSEWEIGLSLGAVGLGSALSQAVLAGWLIPPPRRDAGGSVRPRGACDRDDRFCLCRASLDGLRADPRLGGRRRGHACHQHDHVQPHAHERAGRIAGRPILDHGVHADLQPGPDDADLLGLHRARRAGAFRGRRLCARRRDRGLVDHSLPDRCPRQPGRRGRGPGAGAVSMPAHSAYPRAAPSPLRRGLQPAAA